MIFLWLDYYLQFYYYFLIMIIFEIHPLFSFLLMIYCLIQFFKNLFLLIEVLFISFLKKYLNLSQELRNFSLVTCVISVVPNLSKKVFQNQGHRNLESILFTKFLSQPSSRIDKNKSAYFFEKNNHTLANYQLEVIQFARY